jgi:prepilin-type N-terminal cleavage/methylation domain-containing protein
MSKPIKQTSQAGFTLVELAIVMIIIGLLIAGVLKGQELIGNARVTATVAQIKGIDAATSTFKDTYAALPGDITTPAARLPNCAGNCIAPGNGDGVLGTIAAPQTFATVPAAGSEQGAYFAHLNAADLITGIQPNGAVPLSFGGIFPQAKIDGVGLIAGSIPTPSVATMPAGLAVGAPFAGVPSGLFLSLTSSATAASGVATEGLIPTQASRIDTKLDDGNPTTGSVIGYGAATCGTAALSYITSTTSNVCGIYVRIQG